MPEIGEPATIAEVIANEHDPHCYFCNAKEDPKTETNDLTADFDEDAPGADLRPPEGGKFKNDAGKLGKALGSSLSGVAVVDGDSHAVTTAAHHLIPGNAALKKSMLFSSQYLWTDGEAKGNIGYNVNSAPNGVWLPGNYAIRPWGPLSDDRKRAYAFAAMRAMNAQFHDAHSKYSDFVLQCLDKIHDKLEMHQTVWCPEAKKRAEKDDPKERNSLYVLNSRLHTISHRMRSFLTGPVKAWRLNVWTSHFALEYLTAELSKVR